MCDGGGRAEDDTHFLESIIPISHGAFGEGFSGALATSGAMHLVCLILDKRCPEGVFSYSSIQ